MVVIADDERLVFCDYERHETLARETAHYDDAVFYRECGWREDPSYDGPAPVLAKPIP